MHCGEGIDDRNSPSGNGAALTSLRICHTVCRETRRRLSVMIKTVRVGDIVGFRTFTSVIRYGEVVDVLARGEGGRPNRRDEISVRLKPDGQVVMVQRWRLAERYDHRKI